MILTAWCTQLYARAAASAEGVTCCALFRSGEALMQPVREPLPHAAVKLREIPCAAQQHVQGRAVLRLELRVCHASPDVLPTKDIVCHVRDQPLQYKRVSNTMVA